MTIKKNEESNETNYNKQEFYKKLISIQEELKVPKDKYSEFGQHPYRSAEDIFNKFKEVNKNYNLLLTVTDEIIYIGNRFYIKATAKITDGENIIENVAYAREQETHNKMSVSQLSGSCSSYARKYAMGGLFCVDNEKDPDTDEFKKDQENKSQNKQNENVFESTLPPQTKQFQFEEPSEELLNEIKLMINMLPVDDTEKKEIVKNYSQEEGISKKSGKQWERYINNLETLKNNFDSYSNIKIYHQLKEKLQTHL